jgi:hypothetical protein
MQAQVPAQLDKKLASQSPWLLIAILMHVAVVAVASVLYYEHGTPCDDVAPTEITIAAAAPEAMLVPPVVIDRDRMPEFEDDVPDASDQKFNIDSVDEPPQGNSDDRSDRNDILPPGEEGGASAIAPGKGPGYYSNVPSTKGGKPGGQKYGQRDTHGTGDGVRRTPRDHATARGLEWLVRHQDEDGRWDADQFMKHDLTGEACTGPGNSVNDVGVTALALLALLGDGNTLKVGPYRKVLRSGVRWLVEQQDPDTGLIGVAASQSFMYSHAIAAMVLCEAYGLSEHKPLQRPAQAAIGYIAHARNPYGVWRYQPRDNDGDSSVTAWMVQALLSAKEFGLAVDDTALQTASVWFDGVTDATTGTAGYTKVGEGSSRPIGKLDKFPAAKSEALTSAVLLCRCLMHIEEKPSPVMNLAAERILAKPPVWNEADGSIDMYYWYYASYALYQIGGKPWDTWSKKMLGAMVKTQRQDGNSTGSWDPVDPWGEEGGRVYSTAIMVLCLQSHFRYGRVLGAR